MFAKKLLCSAHLSFPSVLHPPLVSLLQTPRLTCSAQCLSVSLYVSALWTVFVSSMFYKGAPKQSSRLDILPAIPFTQQQASQEWKKHVINHGADQIQRALNDMLLFNGISRPSLNKRGCIPISVFKRGM